MHTGLRPALDVVTGPPAADPMITLLDGGLGAVTDPLNRVIAGPAEVLCWCGCMICHVDEPEPAVGPRSA